MKHVRTTLLLLIAVSPAPTIAADAEAGLLVIRALGSVNGQALACSEAAPAARAKQLMLAHAPKTQRFGAAYDEATQEAFTAQTRSGKPCADATEFTARLNQLALQLSETLPVAAK